MVLLTESELIENNVIGVLVKLDKEMRDHPRSSIEFDKRMKGIIFILSRIEEDFSEDFLIFIIMSVKELLGHNLPMTRDLCKKLVNRGFVITNVRSVYSI